MPAKSRYSHRLLLKTLHRLANSHLHSKRDTYIYKESLLLYRWLFTSLCKVFNGHICTHIIFSRYIYACTYVPAKSRYSHRLLLKNTHRLAKSHLHSKRVTYIYKESRLLHRWLFTRLCVVFNRHICTHIIFSRYIYTCTYAPFESRYSHTWPWTNATHTFSQPSE